jgi:hypothetical protein
MLDAKTAFPSVESSSCLTKTEMTFIRSQAYRNQAAGVDAWLASGKEVRALMGNAANLSRLLSFQADRRSDRESGNRNGGRRRGGFPLGRAADVANNTGVDRADGLETFRTQAETPSDFSYFNPLVTY